RVRTVVLVELGAPAPGAAGRQVAFEVDAAGAGVREEPLPVPRGQTLPWAVGVAEQGESRGGGLVPILDLDALGDRILRRPVRGAMTSSWSRSRSAARISRS